MKEGYQHIYWIMLLRNGIAEISHSKMFRIRITWTESMWDGKWRHQNEYIDGKLNGFRYSLHIDRVCEYDEEYSDCDRETYLKQLGYA